MSFIVIPCSRELCSTLFVDPLATRHPDFEGKIYELELFKGETGIGMHFEFQ